MNPKNPIKSINKQVALIALVALAVVALGGGSAVAGKLLTGKDIKNSSLTGKDIKNGSISSSDLSSKTKQALAGQKGATGATGAPGSSAPIAFRSSAAAQLNENYSYANLTEGGLDVDVPTGSSKLLVQFAAECSVTHPSQYARVFVRVMIDGMPTAAPAESAFCSNESDFNHDHYVGASILRVVNVAPGPHHVQIQFTPDDADAVARIDDPVLSVQVGN